MIADKACAERGCACHDPRDGEEGVEMVPKRAINEPVPVDKFSHPDVVGGIVWSDLELAWIKQRDEQWRQAQAVAPLIAGAIFDFAGFLTTRTKVIEVGSSANAGALVELIKQWAEHNGLPLDDAQVFGWEKALNP